MTRFSRKAGDEVSDRDSDSAKRRTVPADVGPASPSKIDALYRHGKKFPSMGSGPDYQKPQDPIDRRSRDYDNDTKRGWLRGEGADGRSADFDHGHYDLASKPQPASGPKCRASGRDAGSSPFSKASKTYGED